MLMRRTSRTPHHVPQRSASSVRNAPMARPMNTPSFRSVSTETVKQEKPVEVNAQPDTSAVPVTANVAQQHEVAHPRARGGRLYDPFFDDWRDFSRRMDKYLTSSFGTPSFWDPFERTGLITRPFQAMKEFQPSVDISETDKAYHVVAELPGIPKENVKVSIKDGMLEIRGNKDTKKEVKDEKRNYTRVERTSGSFVRRIAVPKDVDATKVKAKFENGVLELDIAKPEPAQQEQFHVRID